MSTQESIIQALIARGVKPQLQYRTCGKPACKRCHDGRKHGPYFYLYIKVNGKLKGYYIGKKLPGQEQHEKGV